MRRWRAGALIRASSDGCLTSACSGRFGSYVGEVLLVAGSSLTVFSGRRFVPRAQQQRMPVAIVNLGPTRADDLARAKIEGRLGDVLPRLAEALSASA